MADLGWKHLTEEDKAQILAGIREGKAIGGPYHVEIHPADRCNIACFFCSTAAIRGTDEIILSRWQDLLAELKKCGARSLRLSGGGEPLFHREIKRFLGAVEDSGLPIENITTNGVLLGGEVARMVARVCDEVTVSINTADAESYGSMMKTPPRNFHRVVENVRALAALRDSASGKVPRINLQFLVWKGNFRSIPEMYRLSRELRCDTVFFNGLAFLNPADRMCPDEIAEMLALYEQVIKIDEYRTVSSIESYEQPITDSIRAIAQKISLERGSLPRRVFNFFANRQFSIKEKLEHRRRLRERRRTEGVSELNSSCIIGWHSLVIRTNGDVAPCCILQGKKLGNVYTSSLESVWYGEAYQSFRSELTEVMKRGSAWQADASHQIVESVCGRGVSGGCPIASFYYKPDVPFGLKLSEMAGPLGEPDK